MTAIEMCERLATLGRAGYGIRAALIELSGRSDAKTDVLIPVGRRAALGAPIDRCLEPLAETFGPELSRLAACLVPGAGTNWPEALDELAKSIRERADAHRAATVAGSGATLSARTVAVLPLLMFPVAARQLADPLVMASVVLGLALGSAGYRWLLRTVPAVPPEDPEAVLADDVGALLRAGLSLDGALRSAVSARSELTSALHRANLGAPWPVALRPDAPAIAFALSDAQRTGSPVAGALRRSASDIRGDARRRFEREVERAPVKMVIPLVCCILPSFVLVAIVPLLRGLAHPA